MNTQLSWIAFSCQCCSILISSQVKREDSDWTIRKEKALVSSLNLKCKQSLWHVIGVIVFPFSKGYLRHSNL